MYLHTHNRYAYVCSFIYNCCYLHQNCCYFIDSCSLNHLQVSTSALHATANTPLADWLAGWLAAGKRFSIVFTTNINQIVSSAWQPKECFRFFIFICFTFFLVFSMLVVVFWPICANAPAISTAAITVSAMSQHLSMPPTQGVAGERLFTPPFCTVAANFLRISYNNGVPTKTVPTRTPTKSRWRQQILCNKPDRQTPLQKHVDICRFMHIHAYINVCKSVCSSTPPGPYCLNLLAKLLRSAFVCRAKGRRFVLQIRRHLLCAPCVCMRRCLQN